VQEYKLILISRREIIDPEDEDDLREGGRKEQNFRNEEEQDGGRKTHFQCI
jgi:hypothetical protein